MTDQPVSGRISRETGTAVSRLGKGAASSRPDSRRFSPGLAPRGRTGMVLVAVAMGLLLLLSMGACGPNIPERNDNDQNGNGNGNDLEIEPVWPQVSDLLIDSCAAAGCHGAGSHILDLSSEESYGAIVGVSSEQVPGLALVEPSDPDASYLYLKLIGLHIAACIDAGIAVSQCGTEMPPPPTPQLSHARLEAIRAWIAEGAEE